MNAEKTSAAPSCNCGRCHGCGKPLAIDEQGAVCGNGNCRRNSSDITENTSGDYSSPYYGPCPNTLAEQQLKTAAKIRQLHSTIDLLRNQRDKLQRELGERTKERDLARAALREFEGAETLPFPKDADHDTPAGKLFANEAAAWAGLEAEDAKTLPQHVSGAIGNE